MDAKGATMDNSLNEVQEDDIMSILLADSDNTAGGGGGGDGDGGSREKEEINTRSDSRIFETTINERLNRAPDKETELEQKGTDEVMGMDDSGEPLAAGDSIDRNEAQSNSNRNSFDDELNMDLLKQYIAVDYEITQLEDKDALRIYHEKIEQLEQLERELDMISSEAEEAAARSETDLAQLARFHSNNSANLQNDSKQEVESNSMISGSISVKSSFRLQKQGQTAQRGKSPRNQTISRLQDGASAKGKNNQEHRTDSSKIGGQMQPPESYSTVEEVFNRKIILEKERDKLKKEVELVIIECDKLQQKYKKRDEILDKLFDGRTGNGLENHLEQQLNWLMEQKHYVDQVFYAWKRAETLTSQTCEQFASALELLKRLPKMQNEEHRNELANNIAQLLIKSRQDMEQAQRYNPNVDAPFFTDTETERFDKIIETISQTQSFTQSEYSQIATVIQFAYKRAVSIRLWLEQILQITIARDSFELAEEYKWIAIQLRKERITLINSKLQEAPYRSMVQSIREQMAQKQNQQSHFTDGAKTSNMIGGTNGNKNEINRDSGVESDAIDIEEEIYRLLEMNKSRLETSVARQSKHPTGMNPGTEANRRLESSYNDPKRDEAMRERIQRRVRGEQPYTIDVQGPPIYSPSGQESLQSGSLSATTNASTPSKLRVELDEVTRQNLLSEYLI